MQAKEQAEVLDWSALGVPIALRFDDPYFSLENGLAETRHVFLTGNGLPERFCDGFHIAELGFGTGLNMLTTLQAWREMGTSGTLRFTSFEAFPIPVDAMRRALALFPELGGDAARFLDAWAQTHGEMRSVQLDGLRLEVHIGDARDVLPRWEGAADAWYLDGFSPAKNPELWSADLMQAVADHTAQGGSFATYTAAGHVRRALAEAGFRVSRIAGYGRKRHMSQGYKS